MIDENSLMCARSALARHRGGTGIRQCDVGCFASHGRAARRSAERAGGDAGAGERAVTVSLKWLLDGIATVPDNDAQIVDLAIDSRDVRVGPFSALRGTKARHVRATHTPHAARARGAAGARALAVVLRGKAFTAPVPNLRRLAGRIADRFFQWPSSQMRIVGITGTNGKTTCAYLITQCLERLGRPVAWAARSAGDFSGGSRHRPARRLDAVSVHRLLAQLKSQGVREVAMEVSSHALDQGVDGSAIPPFTNLLIISTTTPRCRRTGKRCQGAPLLQRAGSRARHHQRGRPCWPRAGAHQLVGGAPLTAVWVGSRADAWLAERFLEGTRSAARPFGHLARHRRGLRRDHALDEAPGTLQRRERAGGARLLAGSTGAGSAGSRRGARRALRRPAGWK